MPDTGLRFSLVRSDGQLLADEIVTDMDTVEEVATRHGRMAADAGDHGQAVTLYVADLSLGGLVLATASTEPEGS